jgi:phosphonate transport system substrate-binding protein
MFNIKQLFLVFLVALLTLSACSREESKKELNYASAPVTQNKKNYTFAVHPLHNPNKLMLVYQPLINYLNQHIPYAHFELESSLNYASYEEKIAKKTPDFLLPNPWQTLGAIKMNYQVIAMAGNENEFKGIFLVRNDSSIKNPIDIKGKTVSYPSSTALAACVMPQYFLFQNGIDINKDIDNRYVGSQESSIMNVYLGEVAIGVTWVQPWKLFQRDHPKEASQLKVIWQTQSRQNNSVMARNDLPPELISQVKTLLLKLTTQENGQAILNEMAIDQFHPADNQSYESLKEFIAEFETKVRKISPK